MKHIVAAAILAISFSASTGCTTMTDMRSSMAQSMRMFRPRPFDEPFDTEEEINDDYDQLVSEARPDMEMERDPDRFWVEKVMSPQARSIERNLGFE